MSYMKRLDEARNSFKNKNLEAARKAHSPEAILSAPEEHGGTGDQYIGDIVYGGLDGVVTTFAAVSGVAGAALGPNIILIMGFANLLADGFSMATGAYLSDKSEQEYYDRERTRESWEVDNFPEGEKLELTTVYKNEGFSEPDAVEMVNIISKQKKTWVDNMMVHELSLLKSEKNPLRTALSTFGAFVVAGLVPMLIFLIRLIVPIPENTSFLISGILAGVALFGLGAAKVRVTGLNPWRSGLEMLVTGGLAAAVAYVVGMLLKGIGV